MMREYENGGREFKQELKRLFINRHRGKLCFVVILMLGSLVSGLLHPYLLMMIVDSLTVKNFPAIQSVLWVVGLLFVVSLVSSLIGTLILNRISADAFYEIKTKLFAALSKTTLKKIEENKGGDFLNRLVYETSSIQESILKIYISIFGSGLTVALTLMFIFFINVWFGVVTAVVIPLFIANYFIFAKKFKRLHRRASENESELLENGSSFIKNMLMAKLYRFHDWWLSRMNTKLQVNREIQLDIGYTYVLNNSLQKIIQNGFSVLVMIGGSLLIVNGSVTIGALIAILTYSNRIFGPLESIIQSFLSLATLDNHFKRVNVFYTLPKEKEQRGSGYHETVHTMTLDDLTFHREETEIFHVGYHQFRKGKLNYIVGSNGSGKSTLLKVLLRFYDCDRGKVWLNDHYDAGCVQLEAYRHLFGMVQIEDNLLPASFEENTIMTNKFSAAPFDLAYVKTLKEKMKSSENISKGEEYIVSLLRIFNADKQVILLDETIANLDKQNKEIVLAYLNAIANEKIIIIVTNEESMIGEKDHVLRLGQDAVAEVG